MSSLDIPCRAVGHGMGEHTPCVQWSNPYPPLPIRALCACLYSFYPEDRADHVLGSIAELVPNDWQQSLHRTLSRPSSLDKELNNLAAQAAQAEQAAPEHVLQQWMLDRGSLIG